MMSFLSLLIASIIVFLPMALIAPTVIVLLGMFLGLVIRLEKKPEDVNFLSCLFYSSFILKIAVSLLIYNFVFTYNGSGLLGDGGGYSYNGYRVLQLWLSGIKDINTIALSMINNNWSGNFGNYDIYNAIVYYFTDKSPLTLIFINCLASSLTVVFVYHITKHVCNEKAARMAAILTAFWPSLFIWSTQNLKESLNNFLIVALIWTILQLKVRFRFYLLFIVALLSLALKELRFVSFLMLYAVIVPFSLILPLWKKYKTLIIFLIISIGLFIAIFPKEYLLDLLPKNKEKFSLMEYLQVMRTYRAYGNTAFLSNVDITNSLQITLFTPIALVVAWLAPFPWQLGSLSQVTAIPEMLVYYFLLPAMFLGWRFIMKYKVYEGGLLLVYIFVMMVVLAFVEGNIGTLFRHRAMVLPIVFVLMGIGLEKTNFRITAHD